MRPTRFENLKAAQFDECFRAHYVRVLTYARRRLPDRSAAEDIAAETFVVAWRRLEDAPVDVVPWLLAIARGMILNELRAGRRRDRLVARVGAEPGDVGVSFEDDGIREAVAGDREAKPVLAALAQLCEGDQEVLRLAAWEALDHRRASRVLGCSRGAYAVRLHRARARLARELAKQAPWRLDRLEEW